MPNESGPTGDTVYWQVPIHDIIMDTRLCSHTEALHKCAVRVFTKQLTEMDAENHSETWDGPWRLLMKTWGCIEYPEDGRNSIGSLTNSMNL